MSSSSSKLEKALKLDGDKLRELCKSNEEYSQICQNQDFWNLKIKRDYPEIIGRYPKNEAKQYWILCEVGARIELKLCTQYTRTVLNKNINIDQYGSYTDSDICDKVILDFYEQIYSSSFANSSSFIGSSFTSSLFIGLLSDTKLIFIQDDSIIFYIRKKTQNDIISRFREDEIRSLQKDLIAMFNHSQIMENICEMGYQHNDKLYYDQNGNLVTQKHKSKYTVLLTKTVSVSSLGCKNDFDINYLPILDLMGNKHLNWNTKIF